MSAPIVARFRTNATIVAWLIRASPIVAGLGFTRHLHGLPVAATVITRLTVSTPVVAGLGFTRHLHWLPVSAAVVAGLRLTREPALQRDGGRNR